MEFWSLVHITLQYTICIKQIYKTLNRNTCSLPLYHSQIINITQYNYLYVVLYKVGDKPAKLYNVIKVKLYYAFLNERNFLNKN